MRVRIIQDCRDNSYADLAYGTHVGWHHYKDDPKNAKCPKIILDDGDVIWGVECWWERVKEDDGYCEECD